MDDLGEGLGESIGDLGGCDLPALTLRATMSLLLASALVATVATGTVLAAKKDADVKAPPGPIESIKGDKYRMDSAKIAKRVTRFADASGDQAFSDGAPASVAPDWSDIVAVYAAPIDTPRKLLTKMAKDFPRGVSGAFYGAQADWQKGDPGVFVAVEMAGKLPADSAGQQVEIGLGGDAATPVQVGSSLDTRAGVERFSLSGVFSDGAYATGTTDVSGHVPGDAIEYYNTDSGVFGFYDRKRATWYLIVPRAADTDSVVVSVRSSTEVGEVIDRLELPGGGHFIDIANPTGGWSKKAGLPPLECRSLETFNADLGVELSDPAGTLIRYSAGMDAAGDPDETAALLGPAIEAMGLVPVALTVVGSDEEPQTVEGELAVAQAGNAVSLAFEAPAGQWSFALGDEFELTTPAGESIIDHTSLTGGAGVLTGAGLDGFVTGDLSCANEASEQPMDPTGESAEASPTVEAED